LILAEEECFEFDLEVNLIFWTASRKITLKAKLRVSHLGHPQQLDYVVFDWEVELAESLECDLVQLWVHWIGQYEAVYYLEMKWNQKLELDLEYQAMDCLCHEPWTENLWVIYLAHS
jgi:hypothetical protein